jgi:tol-pal system protein YbgF
VIIKFKVGSRGLYLLFLFFFFFLGGCASRREIVRFKEQLNYLEKSNQRLEEKIAKIDSLLLEQTNSMHKLRADFNNSWEQTTERLNILEGKFEESTSRSIQLYHKMDELKKPIPRSDSTDLVRTDSSQIQVSLEAKKLYDSAYLDLTKGNYSLAIMGFENYLKYFPQSELASNALYWLGESYYAKEEFSKATLKFKALLVDYPRSDKIPTALYKLGLSYLELGEQVLANRYFGELIDRFPQSSEAKLASERLKNQRKKR